MVEIEHANPYYDDSYAVNSANLGPYGDAINKELIPEIEQRFRGIGAGWARFTYGGSTGGWEALATQVFYPDMYNGAFAACPDPIDFRAYTVINLYEDTNAYALQGRGARRSSGPRSATTWVRCSPRSATPTTWNWRRAIAAAPAASTTSGRRCSVRSGKDGYPEADLRQGDRRHRPGRRRLLARALRPVAHHRARLGDAGAEARRARSTSTSASADTYYLTDAVYFAQERLEALQPRIRGRGRLRRPRRALLERRSAQPNAYSRLHYNFQYLPVILKRIAASAPAGADLTSWRY